MKDETKSTSNSSYYAVISSTIYQEKSFNDYRFAVERAAKDLGFTVMRNSEQPGTTQTKFKNFMKENYPVFILILGDILTANVKDECDLALDLGLTIIPFLKAEKLEGKKASEKTLNNMRTISRTYYENDCRTFWDCDELYTDVVAQLKKYLEEPNKIDCIEKVDIYPRTKELIDSAKHRIILCQKTSSLLLGYRNKPYEKKFYSEVIKWLQSQDSKVEFLHIFSERETKNELNSAEYIAIEEARKNLEELISNKNNITIHLRTSHNLNPCVIIDNNLLISSGIDSYLNIQKVKLSIANMITDRLEAKSIQWVSNDEPNSLQIITDFYEKPIDITNNCVTSERYEIIENNRVSVEYILKALNLDRKYYTIPDNEQFDVEKCKRWNEKTGKKVYTMLKDNVSNEIVGYINAIPVNDKCYNEIKDGKYPDEQIKDDDIIAYDENPIIPKKYNLYFASIVKDSTEDGIRRFRLLYEAFLDKLINLTEDNIIISRVIADAVSEAGKIMCVDSKMNKIKDTEHDNSTIYELKLYPPEFHAVTKKQKELFNILSEKYKEFGEI